MIVQGETRKGPLGRLKIVLSVTKTTSGWSQRFLNFVDNDHLDPKHGYYLNTDYVSKEKIKHLREWWKCDFARFHILLDDDVGVNQSVC